MISDVGTLCTSIVSLIIHGFRICTFVHLLKMHFVTLKSILAVVHGCAERGEILELPCDYASSSGQARFYLFVPASSRDDQRMDTDGRRKGGSRAPGARG